MPQTGDDLGELMAYLDGIASWATGQQDRDVRRFASAWFGDADRVRAVLAPEPAAVRLEVVDFLARSARAGWRRPGMAMQVAGPILTTARDRVAAKVAAAATPIAPAPSVRDHLEAMAAGSPLDAIGRRL